MTPPVLMTVICALTVIIIIRPLTLIILVFLLCMFYRMLELIKKTDTEKPNTHVYIGRMINSRICQKVSKVKQNGACLFGFDFLNNNIKQAYKHQQKRKTKIAKSKIYNLIKQKVKNNGDFGHVAAAINGNASNTYENNKVEVSQNNVQKQQKRKPKMSKPSSGKKEKEELPQESRAIQLLSQIHDMTKSLLHDTQEMIKKFDQDERPLKNSTETYASTLRDLGSSVKATNPEYTAFLEKQAEIYDELGNLQRRLQYELSVRVVTPLSGWLHTDFVRMNAEMKIMYEKKTDYDLVTAGISRNPRDAGLLLQQDLCRREYERQMEITKLELSQLSVIQNEHAKILNQFALTWKEYAASARRLLDQLNSTPSKMTGPG